LEEFYVGIDLGGTSIRVVACDKGSKKISKIKKEPLIRKENIKEEIDNNLISLINLVCLEKSAAGKKLGGIGIAMAALFDRETGTIVSWPNNKKWNGFPLMQYLKEIYKVPVVFEDDANAAAIGEQIAGAGKGYKDLAYVTVSTGIGCGIIINNNLLTGAHGWAGELGHIKTADSKTVCTCGAKGCLQAVASGSAIRKAYLNKEPASDIEVKEIVIRAGKGDLSAKAVFEEAGTYIGDALANLVMILDVPVIILGGGVIEAGDLIIAPILKQFRESLQEKRSAKIVKSKLNDKNGVIGALAFIDKNINGEHTIVL